MRYPILLASIAILVSGCNDRKPKDAEITPPALGEAFAEVMLPPDGRLLSRSGGTDALQLEMRSPHPPAVIANFYRTRLSSPGWSLVSDLTDSTETTQMHAEWLATGQPMWVRISPAGGETAVELIGAVPGKDTAYVNRRRRAADSVNTLVPIPTR